MEDTSEAVHLPIINDVEDDFKDGFPIFLMSSLQGAPVVGVKAVVASENAVVVAVTSSMVVDMMVSDLEGGGVVNNHVC